MSLADMELDARNVGGTESKHDMLRLEDVRMSYELGPVQVDVLKGVSLVVQEGEMVSIMGPSGCGKSTLMNFIGLLGRPLSGRYLLRGHDVSYLSDEERSELRNEHIGFVFQSFDLLPRATVVQNVGLPLIYRGLGKATIKDRAAEALDRVGLADRLEHFPSQLSGGQQERVAVARALVGKPAMVLADEPTGALDPATGQEIMTLFEALSTEQGVAVMVVTHSAEVAERCRRQTYMAQGRFVETLDTRAAASNAILNTP